MKTIRKSIRYSVENLSNIMQQEDMLLGLEDKIEELGHLVKISDKFQKNT